MPFIPTTVLAQPPYSPMLSLSTNLSSAQIKTLHSSPVAIVSAPPAGKMILPMFLAIVFHPVTTPYTTNPGSLVLTFQSTPLFSDTILTQTTKQAASTYVLVTTAAASNFDGQALMLQDDTSDPAAGDGTLTVTTYYAILPTT